jgi:hypothetical protein
VSPLSKKQLSAQDVIPFHPLAASIAHKTSALAPEPSLSRTSQR